MSVHEPVDCDRAVELLHDYLKQELTPALAAEIRAHFARCGDCFAHARFEQNFLALLESRASRERCPGPVRERILAALRTEPEQH